MAFKLPFICLFGGERGGYSSRTLAFKQVDSRKKTEMKRKNLFAILLFFFGVLLFTRVDFLVNESLYHYGLHFNENCTLNT